MAKDNQTKEKEKANNPGMQAVKTKNKGSKNGQCMRLHIKTSAFYLKQRF